MTTPATAPTADDVAACLMAQGFANGYQPGEYQHLAKRVRVVLVAAAELTDPVVVDAVEFTDATSPEITIYALTATWELRWRVQLFRAPMALIAATVTAALN